jgi:hypothetical protein
MRRPPKGGTKGPGPTRPGYGYGRSARVKPGLPLVQTRPWLDPAWWLEVEHGAATVSPSERVGEHS